MINPGTFLYATFIDKAGQDAQTLREKDDGAGCLRELGTAGADDPPARIVLRATCEMLTGHCAAGARRIRAIPFSNKPALDMSLAFIEQNYCPSTEGDSTTQVRRFEAQAVLGPRLIYSMDRYIAQLLSLTDNPAVANVPAGPAYAMSDGPTVVAKGYMRIVPSLRSLGKCDKAAALAARAAAAGINIPDDPSAKLRCP